ncbi:MAG: hypothetical protein IT249_18805, partial [Chitinophagaceae bacterium]|nr:hypothetical protein [Chitinophagaceae bacterium]
MKKAKPVRLLTDLSWSFTEEKFSSINSFNKQFTREQEEIKEGEDTGWEPGKIIFDKGELNILFTGKIKTEKDLAGNETVIHHKDFEKYKDQKDKDGKYFVLVA